jgi:hypothetical protein
MCCRRISHHKIEDAMRAFHHEIGKHVMHVMSAVAKLWLLSADQANALPQDHIKRMDSMSRQSSLWSPTRLRTRDLRILARHCDADHAFDGWPALTV